MTPQDPKHEGPSSESTLILGPGEARGEEGGTRPMFRETEGRHPSFEFPGEPRKSFPVCCWVAVFSSICSLVLAGILVFRSPAGAAPAPSQGAAGAAKASSAPAGPAQQPSPALQPYLEAAQKGDTSAMRMLGAMYYHGLDLPRDRAEGLRWYRRAAEAGSKIAQDELRQLE